MPHSKKATEQETNDRNMTERKSNASAKSKEVQTNSTLGLEKRNKQMIRLNTTEKYRGMIILILNDHTLPQY